MPTLWPRLRALVRPRSRFDEPLGAVSRIFGSVNLYSAMAVSIFGNARVHHFAGGAWTVMDVMRRLIEAEVDGVELALARREPAVGRKDARDVGLVYL